MNIILHVRFVRCASCGCTKSCAMQRAGQYCLGSSALRDIDLQQAGDLKVSSKHHGCSGKVAGWQQSGSLVFS